MKHKDSVCLIFYLSFVFLDRIWISSCMKKITETQCLISVLTGVLDLNNEDEALRYSTERHVRL